MSLTIQELQENLDIITHQIDRNYPSYFDLSVLQSVLSEAIQNRRKKNVKVQCKRNRSGRSKTV